MKFALALLVAAAFALPAEALEWRWSYQGEGVTRVGRVHHQGHAQRRWLLRDHGNQGRDQWRRHYRPAACWDLNPRQRRLSGRQPRQDRGSAAHPARLRLCARQRNLRQSLLRGPFRQAGHLRVLLRSREPSHQRTRGDVHRDHLALTMTAVCTKDPSHGRPLAFPTPTTLKRASSRASATYLSAFGFEQRVSMSANNLHRRRSGHHGPPDPGEARGLLRPQAPEPAARGAQG